MGSKHLILYMNKISLGKKNPHWQLHFSVCGQHFYMYFLIRSYEILITSLHKTSLACKVGMGQQSLLSEGQVCPLVVMV